MDKGEQVVVTFRVTLPIKASDEAIKEWVRFELGNNGSMSESPLGGYDLDADWGTFGNI